MAAKGAKKMGFFQRLFGPDPTLNRKVKGGVGGVKKATAPKPTEPSAADQLLGKTPNETQPPSTQPPRSGQKTTGQGNNRVQAAPCRATTTNSSTLSALVVGTSSTHTAVKSPSIQAGPTTKPSTQPGMRVAKSTIQPVCTPVKSSNPPTCPSTKGGPSRPGSEPGRRAALPAKHATTSGSRARAAGKASSSSSSSSCHGTKPSRHPTRSSASSKKRSQRRRKKRPSIDDVMVDTSRPLVYPTTPEMILAYHKAKSFLSRTEEWVIVSLNEYECMVDSVEVIRTMAKHSQFFEIEPEELCEEFFEFVEDVPAYDEVINADIWQEFRYEKYNW